MTTVNSEFYLEVFFLFQNGSMSCWYDNSKFIVLFKRFFFFFFQNGSMSCWSGVIHGCVLFILWHD